MPWYNKNIVESGIKPHNPNPNVKKYWLIDTYFCFKHKKHKSEEKEKNLGFTGNLTA